MRLAPIALVSTFALSFLAASFAACSGGSGQPPSSSGADGPRASGAASAGGAPTAGSAAAPADPVQACVAVPAKEAKCEGLAVMQNGGAVDAGPSSRTQAICDVVKSHRDGFRCCYDLWAKDHPGVSASVTVTLEVAHGGTLKGVTVDKAKSPLVDPGFEKCVSTVAESLTYPESPTGMATRYTNTFDFKAKP